MRLAPLVALTTLLAACASATPPATSVATSTAAVVRTDIARTQPVSGTISYGTATTLIALGARGVVTWTPAPGTLVSRGGRLYSVDATPTILLYGSMPAYRALSAGASGTDVRQLELNLIALGYTTRTSLSPDGRFTAADAAAVRRWQRSIGVSATGAVPLGGIVFSPAPLRISAIEAGPGSVVGPGAPVVTATAADVYVQVALDTSYVAFVHRGDAVKVTLPDLNTQVNGRVAWIAAAATIPGGPNEPNRPTISVRVNVDDPRLIAGFDGAPVQVAITFDVHRQVLAVPVLALLALPDGGYAVRVVRGAERTVVRVDPGIQDSSGLVEVNGDGLAAGDLVEVPVS